MGTPRISVLIATYNSGAFITDAIESVLRQTLPRDAFEIIVIDDGSTDDTEARLHAYGNAIRYWHQANRGQASAWNEGLARTRGEIVAFLDADDLWYDDKLTLVLTEFDRSPDVGVVSHTMAVINDEGAMIGEAPHFRLYPAAAGDRYPLRAYLRGKPPVLPPTSGIAVRSTCLNRIRPIPEEFRGGHDAPGADLYVAYLLPFYAAEFVLIKDRLGAYRIHGPTLREGGLEHVTLAHLQNTIEAYGRLRSYVDRAAKESGHDASAIARKFEAVAREANIRLHALRRKRLTALRLVLRHEDPEFQGSGLSRTFRRLTLILDVLMPRRPYLRLRTWYRRSRLFDLVHGSTE